MRPAALPLLLSLLLAPCVAQTVSRPIQDNSFLVEEAYNQEPGVVQHISSFSRYAPAGNWSYAFTQEWPAPRHARHQLSYTASLVSPEAGTHGLGDIALNYRYQLIGSGDTRLAFAPRVSLLLATASPQRGNGGNGVQINLPLSVAHSRRLVTHWNAGASFVPNARDANHQHAALSSYNLGQSVVWLAHPRFNVLLETVWLRNQAVAGERRAQSWQDLWLSPGIRWSHQRGPVQIVPGIGVPIGVGPSAGRRGLIVYLSFEHALWREEAE